MVDIPPKPWPTGLAERVEPLVRRVLAPNPSPYTFTGTETYIVGAGSEVAVIDPGPAGTGEAGHADTNGAGHVAAILEAIGTAKLVAICCTHAHDDHVNVAPELRRRVGAPILLHPDDHELWRLAHDSEQPDRELADGQRVEVAGTYLQVLHTPGHAPGGVCLLAPEIGTLFSGDTLFAGGPGATGRSYSDFPTIIESIRSRLLTLPPSTVVNPGHGDSTSIGAEAPHLQEWIERGH